MDRLTGWNNGDLVKRVEGTHGKMGPGQTAVVEDAQRNALVGFGSGHHRHNFVMVAQAPAISPAPTAREADPTGKDPHQPGAKLDAGKVEMGLILNGMPRALLQVARVGTYGASKYTRDGWLSVPDGPRRYTDAMYRHLNAEARGELHDADTQLEHAAHAAWNALARLELLLRGQGTA